MVVPVDVSKTKAKKTNFKKNKTSEKVSSFDKDTYVHVHKPVDSMNKDNVDNEVDTTENIVNPSKTTIDSHVEPNVEPCGNHLLNHLLEYMLNHLVKNLLNLLVNLLFKLLLNPLLDQLLI